MDKIKKYTREDVATHYASFWTGLTILFTVLVIILFVGIMPNKDNKKEMVIPQSQFETLPDSIVSEYKPKNLQIIENVNFLNIGNPDYIYDVKEKTFVIVKNKHGETKNILIKEEVKTGITLKESSSLDNRTLSLDKEAIKEILQLDTVDFRVNVNFELLNSYPVDKTQNTEKEDFALFVLFALFLIILFNVLWSYRKLKEYGE